MCVCVGVRCVWVYVEGGLNEGRQNTSTKLADKVEQLVVVKAT